MKIILLDNHDIAVTLAEGREPVLAIKYHCTTQKLVFGTASGRVVIADMVRSAVIHDSGQPTAQSGGWRFYCMRPASWSPVLMIISSQFHWRQSTRATTHWACLTPNKGAFTLTPKLWATANASLPENAASAIH